MLADIFRIYFWVVGIFLLPSLGYFAWQLRRTYRFFNYTGLALLVLGGFVGTFTYWGGDLHTPLVLRATGITFALIGVIGARRTGARAGDPIPLPPITQVDD